MVYSDRRKLISICPSFQLRPPSADKSTRFAGTSCGMPAPRGLVMSGWWRSSSARRAPADTDAPALARMIEVTLDASWHGHCIGKGPLPHGSARPQHYVTAVLDAWRRAASSHTMKRSPVPRNPPARDLDYAARGTRDEPQDALGAHVIRTERNGCRRATPPRQQFTDKSRLRSTA
jgi:hypothetical protein